MFSEGNYTYVFKAVDSHGAESEWSDPLTINVEKGQLWQTPIVRYMRFSIKHPNSFPLIKQLFYL